MRRRGFEPLAIGYRPPAHLIARVFSPTLLGRDFLDLPIQSEGHANRMAELPPHKEIILSSG